MDIERIPRELSEVSESRDASQTGILQNYCNEVSGFIGYLASGLYKNDFKSLLEEVKANKIRPYEVFLRDDKSNNPSDVLLAQNNPNAHRLNEIGGEINEKAENGTLTEVELKQLLKEFYKLIYGYDLTQEGFE